jgi:glutamate synthase domain-containing protein 1
MEKKPMPSLLKKLIDMFKKAVITAAFAFIRAKYVKLINHAELRNLVEKSLIPAEVVVEKLTDKDPNNAAQMQQVWLQYKDQFENDSIEMAIEIVRRKVKDEATRNLIIAALESLDD